MGMFDTTVFTEQASKTALDALKFTCNPEYSFFNETLDFMIESNKRLNDATLGFYKSILESGSDSEVITESFSDLFENIKKVIDAFIKFIKNLVNRFIVMLNGLVKNDKFIINHKKDFEKFSHENNFDFTGYNFTINELIPLADPVSDIIDGADINFVGFARDYSSKPSAEQLEYVKSAYSSLITNLENGFYDMVRGKIIGKDYDIDNMDFSNELFKVYRNDVMDTEEFNVDASLINEILERFINNAATVKSVEKQKQMIEESYKKVKDEISKLVTVNKSSGVVTATVNPNLRDPNPARDAAAKMEITKEIAVAIDLYVKARVSQIQKMTDIHAMAFAAKLDAIKDMHKQDSKILYRALYTISPKKS